MNKDFILLYISLIFLMVSVVSLSGALYNLTNFIVFGGSIHILKNVGLFLILFILSMVIFIIAQVKTKIKRSCEQRNDYLEHLREKHGLQKNKNRRKRFKMYNSKNPQTKK